jgi:hypothetical protein
MVLAPLCAAQGLVSMADLALHLARSTDGGRSWDEPVVVDQTPDGVDAFTAAVDVDGTGRVAVNYYDFRNDETGDDELSTDFWVAHSHDGRRRRTARPQARSRH